MTELGFKSTLKLPYEEAIGKVTEALKAEGFGVPTNIDVKDTMKKRLDVDFRKYSILGVCNPPLAHKVLSTRIDAGLLLPCTLIVYEEGDGVVVNILDPLIMSELIPEPELQAVMVEVRARLERVSEGLNRQVD
jgi:uncharacterized protein (DUF302 family)